jgi:hypothetical protein
MLIDLLKDFVQEKRFLSYLQEEWSSFFIGMRSQMERTCKIADSLEDSLTKAYQQVDALTLIK